MSSLDTMKTRLQYHGGNQEGRMQSDKLKTLKKALLYSYQAATAILEDGREFRCLINPDKNRLDYEDKIISIPFKDICLNKPKTADKTLNGEEEIGMKPGDVFTWKETNTYWLVYLQRLEEDAYFRAEIRQCEHEIEINDKKYKVYLRGPDQTSILWHTRRGFGSWNDLNYDIVMYITNNEETKEFFRRFTIIKIDGKPWEVQIVDSITTEGIIQICLKEYFKNTIKEEAELEELNKKPAEEEIDETLPHIQGDTIAYPYDKKEYFIKNADNGIWMLSNNKAKIIKQTKANVIIEIVTGRSGNVNLVYKRENNDDIVQTITIQSL